MKHELYYLARQYEGETLFFNQYLMEYTEENVSFIQGRVRAESIADWLLQEEGDVWEVKSVLVELHKNP